MFSEKEILEYIARYEKLLNDSSFYVGSNIPEKKRTKAVKAYGNQSIGTVLALYDGTIFGSAKEGFMFTEHSIFYHYVFSSWVVAYDEIDHFEIERNNYERRNPKTDVLHIVTKTDDYKIDMNSLDKRYLLAMLEDICGIGYDGECRDDNYKTECDHRYKNARWHGESLEFWQTRISEGDSKSDDDRRYEDKDDNRSSEDGKIRDNTGAVVEASKYFKKGRCIYCNSRTTTQNGEVICKECNRINKPMYPISILNFKPILEKDTILMRMKISAGYKEEVISAADEGRLKIASAVSDGFYSSELRYDSDSTESDQFIRSPKGVPIEGRFYSYPLQEEGAPVWIVQLEKKNGKKAYILRVKDKYERLADAMVGIEYDLFPVDEYEPKKRSDGY